MSRRLDISNQIAATGLERTLKIVIFIGVGLGCISLTFGRTWDGLSVLFIFWAVDFFYRAWRHLTRTKEDEYTREVEHCAQYFALGLVATVCLALYWLVGSGSYWSIFGLGVVVGTVAVSGVASLIALLRLMR